MTGLFRRDVYIRLADDGTNFVSTTKFGRFYTKIAEIALKRQAAPEAVDEKSLAPVKKSFLHGVSERK